MSKAVMRVATGLFCGALVALVGCGMGGGNGPGSTSANQRCGLVTAPSTALPLFPEEWARGERGEMRLIDVTHSFESQSDARGRVSFTAHYEIARGENDDHPQVRSEAICTDSSGLKDKSATYISEEFWMPFQISRANGTIARDAVVKSGVLAPSSGTKADLEFTVGVPQVGDIVALKERLTATGVTVRVERQAGGVAVVYVFRESRAGADSFRSSVRAVYRQSE